ncbi:unnamed protein product [Chrysoparadoxa australica]
MEASTSFLLKKEKKEEKKLAGDKKEEATTTEQVERTLSTSEVTKRLRALGQPVTLFGEELSDRVARLKLAEGEQTHDDFGLGHGHNVANTFLGSRKGRQQRSEQQKRDEEKEDEEDDEHEAAAAAEEREGAADDKPLDPNTKIRRFFRGLLKQWEQDLLERPDHIKSSVQGRNETRMQKQTKDYLRPMFKLCKHKQMNPGILQNFVEMVDFMEQGEFVKAHDVYMLTAIGNAPWPIGLTMVGIHERSGREKIETRNVAHVMNNEAQRKYLVSIKRLMTYLQDKRTDVPPSKKVSVR